MLPPLIDTDVLIDALRGYSPAVEWLDGQAGSDIALFASTITRAELLSGMRSGEERALEAMLEALDWVPVSLAVADQAAAYRRTYFKSHGLQLPDALIAATAKVCQARLVTLNRKHFPMDDLDIDVPYVKGAPGLPMSPETGRID